MKFLIAILPVIVATGISQAQPVLPAPSNTLDTVLVSSSRASVTQAEFEAEIQRIPEKDRFEFLTSRSRLAALVENILVNKVLAQEAVESGLATDPAVIAEVKNQTEKVLARHRGKQIRRNAKQVDLLPSARENYTLNKDKYKRNALFETWVVLVTKHKGADVARQRAEEVLKRARSGEPLDALAKQYSDDPTAQINGGLNKLVPIESIEPNVAKAVQKLKVGELAEVVDVPAGYIVVKLTRLIPEKTYTFEEIKSDLLIDARNAYEASFAEAHFNKIKSDPTLKVNIDALERIRSSIPSVSASTEPTAVTSGNSQK